MSAHDHLLSPASERDAQYVEIASRHHGCKVTEGRIYRLERNFNNPHIFDNGEAYIVDDETKDNYSIFMLCKTILYK